MIKASEKDNAGTMQACIGDTIELTLSENPTTGYRWQLGLPVDPLLEIEDDSFTPATAAFGAGGQRKWRFRTLHEGLAHMEIENRRSWDMGASDTFKITIAIKSRSA